MTIEILQLQLIDKVADVFGVHVVQVPQVQVVSLRHDKSLTCPLLSTTGAYGPDSAENCGYLFPRP